MNTHRDDVTAAVRALDIHSATSYSWLGRRSPRIPARVQTALTPASARDYLLAGIQMTMYTEFYCRGGVDHSPPRRTAAPVPTGRTPFIEMLSDANVGRGRIEAGWIVRSATADRIVVGRNGLDLWVRTGEVVASRSAPPVPGDTVGLRLPKEHLMLSPGFYLAVGDQPATEQVTHRLYWNVAEEGAIPLVRTATSLLNRSEVAFRLKVLDKPGSFTRCDAGVLYLSGPSREARIELVREIYAGVATHLRARTPVFTQALAPGLGFAEDTGRGDSFGMNLCALLAEGMVRAHAAGQVALDARAGTVLSTFEAAGVDIDRPFLRPGSRFAPGYPTVT